MNGKFVKKICKDRRQRYNSSSSKWLQFFCLKGLLSGLRNFCRDGEWQPLAFSRSDTCDSQMHVPVENAKAAIFEAVAPAALQERSTRKPQIKSTHQVNQRSSDHAHTKERPMISSTVKARLHIIILQN